MLSGRWVLKNSLGAGGGIGHPAADVGERSGGQDRIGGIAQENSVERRRLILGQWWHQPGLRLSRDRGLGHDRDGAYGPQIPMRTFSQVCLGLIGPADGGHNSLPFQRFQSSGPSDGGTPCANAR